MKVAKAGGGGSVTSEIAAVETRPAVMPGATLRRERLGDVC